MKKDDLEKLGFEFIKEVELTDQFVFGNGGKCKVQRYFLGGAARFIDFTKTQYRISKPYSEEDLEIIWDGGWESLS